ncbi:MAG: McrB family protein [Phocaeicola sp.]
MKVDDLCNLFTPRKKHNEQIDNHSQNYQKHNSYLTAIRTKPFLLLAGISGTGKSRIVRELAFKSCPSYLQDRDKTTPGNYCMIEVKPNWHDSTELLGYYSNLSEGYQFKKFVQFLVKAKMYPEVPFFVCLDEMNLAPVEQYFAEVLSVLETRKSVDTSDGRVIKTGVIVEAQHFQQLGKITGLVKVTGSDYNQHFTDREIYMKLCSLDKTEGIKSEVGNKKELITEGLTLPHNVIIIGTVNMDDTTHQFSRKVIDRAMTIEMNGGNLRDMFGGSKNLDYLDDEKQQEWQRAFRQNYVTADEVLETHPTDEAQIVELLPTKLEEINKALKGTPFEVSYRVLNELTIMVGVILDKQKEGEVFEEIVNRAIDAILLMKILPRIEGDSDMFNLKSSVMVNGVACNNRLEWLRELAPSFNQEEDAAHQQTAKEKIEEMIERLENQEFTRFWP